MCGACSAFVCQVDPNTTVGPTTPNECDLITFHLAKLKALSGAHSVAINSAINLADPVVSENKTKLHCMKPECDDLRMALVFWRDAKWKEIRLSNPFLTHNWVLLDEHIDSLVNKGHIILNAPQVDALLIEKLISWITDDALTASLIVLLEQFQNHAGK
ncbi:hypothetical protein BDQ17DRAFT_1426076 [Cyathus striatus]|nr:hypothetical protein BDQ17DRAFT_1426076 [Cyathus striatus]